MKKIEAIIRPEKLADVKAELEKVGYSGLTIYEVEGHGKQKGASMEWRGTTYKKELMPKLKMEIFATDKDAPKIVHAIKQSGKTGQVGDGKIFVLNVEEGYRIRSGEEGEEVVS